MSQVTFEKLCEELAPFVERWDTKYRKVISVRERVAITLYRLADTASYRAVSNLFGVGKSTVCPIVLEVCSAIVEFLFKRLIHLSVTRQDIETEVVAFFKRAGFPQVVGALDGCHVAILAPNENPADYVNRKGFYSVILQGLVNIDYLFRDVYVGWPGKVHDSRVFKNSPL
ncbi:protein ALP1-like [Stylophora pistillata]|uniref:protein ALP1-like n=1 Tax=Stylophora pistillata TaxID=50429 RepID=UPI000C04E5CE|nr:protein ALP1-like [Stylophora pistillata]